MCVGQGQAVSRSCDISCLRQTCDTACDIRAQAGESGNPHQRRFRPLGDVPLFEKILCINGLGDILAVESGYEEGCKRGARQKPTDFSINIPPV